MDRLDPFGAPTETVALKAQLGEWCPVSLGTSTRFHAGAARRAWSTSPPASSQHVGASRDAFAKTSTPPPSLQVAEWGTHSCALDSLPSRSAAADGAGGQLVDSARWRRGETGSAPEGAAHDLPTVALDSASRCPQPLGQPAPARRVAISTHVRARVAHTAHSPHDDRIEDFSEKGPLRAVRKGAPTGVASRAHEWPAPEVVA
jgi:hypothetical protein